VSYDDPRATRLRAFLARRRLDLNARSIAVGAPSETSAAALNGYDEGLGDCKIGDQWYRACVGAQGFGPIEKKGERVILTTPEMKRVAAKNKKRRAMGKKPIPITPGMQVPKRNAPIPAAPPPVYIAPPTPAPPPAFVAPEVAPDVAPDPEYAPEAEPAPEETDMPLQTDEYYDPLTNPGVVEDLQGMGYDPGSMDLGFSFGKVFKNITKAVAPVLKTIPGVVGGVIGNTLGIVPTPVATQPAPTLPPPPRPVVKKPAPKPAGFSLGNVSPAMLGIGALALVLILKKK
jgi:hypothetical protein